MTYGEGFLTAVPVARRDDDLAHAERAATLIRDMGATRMVGTWGDDVPDQRLGGGMAERGMDGMPMLFGGFHPLLTI